MKPLEYYHISADQGRLFRKLIEWLGVSSAIIMGAQFINTGYHPYETIYAPMQVAAPAWAWGIIIFILGITRAVVLIVNGWWPHTHLVRQWLSVCFLFFLWLPLASCFWWAWLTDYYADDFKTYSGLAYAIFTVGCELVIFYAHTSFLYVTKRGRNE